MAYGDPSPTYEELAARVADLEDALDPQTLRQSLEYTTNSRGLKDTYRLVVPPGNASAVNPSPWVPLAYANTYTNYNAGYQAGSCAKDSAGHVFLRGLVTKGTGLPAVSDVIAVLPVGYRPLRQQIFVVPAGENNFFPARIDVAANGNVIFAQICNNTAQVEQDYFDFGGIHFWTT